MPWSKVIGQERVKNILLHALRNGRLPHAYLFYGMEGVGKDAMAIELASTLHCERNTEEACGACASCLKMHSLEHPDIKFVVALPVGKSEQADDTPLARLPEADVRLVQEQLALKGKNPYHRVTIPRATIIKINSIRDVRRESSMTTFDRKRRVIIISNADRMGDEAANTLLKTLEEPSGNTMLILTTAHRDRLLPTIISRCQGVRFDPLSEQEISATLIERNNVDPQQAVLVGRLANGSYVRALELLEDDVTQQRQEVLAFIRHMLGSNILVVTEAIDKVGGLKDRELVVRFLSLVLMWFRDALVVSNGGEAINIDQQNDIRNFLARFPGADLHRVVTEVERAISLVQRNVYIGLTLLQLAVRVRAIILPPEQHMKQEQHQAGY